MTDPTTQRLSPNLCPATSEGQITAAPARLARCEVEHAREGGDRKSGNQMLTGKAARDLPPDSGSPGQAGLERT